MNYQGTDARNRESERQRTTRLQREGRLDAFDRRVQQLKSQAVTKPQRSAAFQRAIVEFAAPAAVVPDDTVVDPEVFAGKAPCSYSTTLHWVADSLDAPVEPKDAPAARAWSLLQEARRDRRWFFEKVHSVLAPGKSAQEKQAREEADDADFRASVARIAADANRDQADDPEWWSELVPRLAKHPARWRKLRADVDATLKGTKRSEVVHDTATLR